MILVECIIRDNFVKLMYTLDHWFRRTSHSKTFLIWSFGGYIVQWSGGYIVQWSGTICAKSVEDTIGDSSVKFTCFWASGSGGHSVKRSFLARASHFVQKIGTPGHEPEGLKSQKVRK